MAGQVDIDGARERGMSLARVDIGQCRGVDNRAGLNVAEEPGQFIGRRRVANVPFPGATEVQFWTAGHRVHQPFTAGLSKDTACDEAMSPGYEEIYLGAHRMNNSVLMKKLRFPALLRGTREGKLFFGLIWFNFGLI